MTGEYYNIGAGNFTHPEWTNVDLPSPHYQKHQPAGFLPHDLTSLKPLPIYTESASLVYCSHVIEHVNDEAVARLLSEAYRVLEPGGGLRLVTPDIELAHRNWLRGDRKFFKPHLVDTGHEHYPMTASVTQLFLHHFASQLCEIDADNTAVRKVGDEEVESVFQAMSPEDALNHFCGLARFNPDRPENHINWFDDAKLIRMVQEAGFKTVYRSGIAQSLYPQMRDVRMFDPHFEISLFVEAVR